MPNSLQVAATLLASPPGNATALSASEEGYNLGLRVGAQVGAFVHQFGPYLGALALACALWLVYRRRTMPKPAKGRAT
ncbi:hypothetical protein [Stenotrophomonas sp. UBA7606]|uniref:hypothetical protein n=1 Tax=Stenotrophomonas sp. UBA7606 TaxID=1947559 RepID=UPI0025FC6B0D|nr:hypothetical protein [Stenotrophomonas sp. UBA7606]